MSNLAALQQLSSMAEYYLDKYGDAAQQKLAEDARFCEREGDLPRRNRLLRIQDELLLLGYGGD